MDLQCRLCRLTLRQPLRHSDRPSEGLSDRHTPHARDTLAENVCQNPLCRQKLLLINGGRTGEHRCNCCFMSLFVQNPKARQCDCCSCIGTGPFEDAPHDLLWSLSVYLVQQTHSSCDADVGCRMVMQQLQVAVASHRMLFEAIGCCCKPLVPVVSH